MDRTAIVALLLAHKLSENGFNINPEKGEADVRKLFKWADLIINLDAATEAEAYEQSDDD